MCTPTSNEKEKIQQKDVDGNFGVTPYPVDISLFLPSPNTVFDAAGIPYYGNPARYNPTVIAQYALAHWNRYLATNNEHHRNIFLTHANWLVEHEVIIDASFQMSGWPVAFPHPDVHTEGSWLSALAQGCGLSVLVRAYQLTQEEVFLEVARRAVRTFERDILDGGVSAPVGVDGVFFEEVAVYPATHILSGFIFALLGLYDYVALTSDAQIETLIHRSLTTMHNLLDEFDIGFWTRSDLLHRQLSSLSHLALQASLLEALARHSKCDHCLTLAVHWKSYQHRFGSRLRYLIASGCAHYSGALLCRVQHALFHKEHGVHNACKGLSHNALRVCVPITAFPVAGGMRTAVAGIAQATSGIWQMEYLTQYVGPNPDGLVIHQFGTRKMGSWQFPTVWFYFLAGGWKLFSLMRGRASYQVILPQDGVSTAAFASLMGKLAGLRVVCMDYGNMTLLANRTYRTERVKVLATRSWSYRLLGRLRFVCYWPSLYVLAWIATHFVDHYLVAGIAGDGVEEVFCKQLGVHPSRITRYPYMIDTKRHIVFDTVSRADTRAKYGIAVDAIVIIMICRLAPEKGLDIALESISQALSVLSPEQGARVRVIIAGDGPLRKQVEEDINNRKLSEICLLWGEASREDVVSLLGISDVFLHMSTRGAYYTMSILEAMASACALVASAEPSLNEQLLADGRGIVVPAGNAEQTAQALVRILNDPQLRSRMGNLARDYIAVQHSPTMLRRVLMRVTYWSALDEILNCRK
jgi:glycosyltransferase involved in cell wall biosynthesis